MYKNIMKFADYNLMRFFLRNFLNLPMKNGILLLLKRLNIKNSVVEGQESNNRCRPIYCNTGKLEIAKGTKLKLNCFKRPMAI